MENTQVKLSFIVPVYNVEPYLRKCVDSLLAQNIDDYEIILVDDGSTDGSGDLCDEIVRANEGMSRADALNEPHTLNDGRPMIRVIHQENGGLSAARNSGIKVANGEYICFVDSDDYWQINVLAGLMAQIERDKLDVLRFRLQYVNSQYEVYNPYKSDPFKGNDYSEIPTVGVSFLNSRMNTQCYAWQFIIKRSLIYNDGKSRADALNEPLTLNDTCLFTPGIYFEDTDWTPRMLVKAKRVASTNTVVYNYLVREGSITNAVNRSKQKKVLDDKMRLIDEMQRQAIDMHKAGRYNIWYSKMIADTVISVIGILSTTFYAENEMYIKQLQNLKVFPIVKNSIKARLINFSPRFAVKLLHTKNG